MPNLTSKHYLGQVLVTLKDHAAILDVKRRLRRTTCCSLSGYFSETSVYCTTCMLRKPSLNGFAWSENHYTLPPNMRGISACDGCHAALGYLNTGIDCIRCILNEWRMITAPHLKIQRDEAPILEQLAAWSESDDLDPFGMDSEDSDSEESSDENTVIGNQPAEENQEDSDSDEENSAEEEMAQGPTEPQLNGDGIAQEGPSQPISQLEDLDEDDVSLAERLLGKSPCNAAQKRNPVDINTDTDSDSDTNTNSTSDSDGSQSRKPQISPPTPPRMVSLLKILKKARLHPNKPSEDDETIPLFD